MSLRLFQQLTKFVIIDYSIKSHYSYDCDADFFVNYPSIVIVKAFYLLLLYVAIQLGTTLYSNEYRALVDGLLVDSSPSVLYTF